MTQKTPKDKSPLLALIDYWERHLEQIHRDPVSIPRKELAELIGAVRGRAAPAPYNVADDVSAPMRQREIAADKLPLPPLPFPPRAWLDHGEPGVSDEDAACYSADQMRDYARAALAQEPGQPVATP